MDPPQHRRSPIGVREMFDRRLGTRRPWRVDHRDQAHQRRHRADRRGKQQRAGHTVAFGQPRDHQRAQPDAQRGGRLPDPHGQAASFDREPADHQPPAGRIAARGRHTAEKEESADGDQRFGEGGGERRRRYQHRPDRQHNALAVAVDDIAPRDQRDHQPETRHRGKQARRREVKAPLAVQCGDEKRHTVDEHVGARRGRQRDTQQRPSPCSGERLGGHRSIVA